MTTTQREALGPAERTIQMLLSYTDHMVHNRTGVVAPAQRTGSPVRVEWEWANWREVNGEKIVHRVRKVPGKRTQELRVGVLQSDGITVREHGAKVAEFRNPGLFPEVAEWMYRQIAEVWKLDNEFAAHWASYAFDQDNHDMKVALCAFMLVQNRCGAPVLDGGKRVCDDEDYRDVGEAMVLTLRKGKRDIDPRLLMRVFALLELPCIAAINRELGFTTSAREPALGRLPLVVEKYLRHREENPKLLEGWVKAGFRRTVMRLAKKVGYKPSTPKFFETLRWKQEQAADGRRSLAIGVAVSAAESWEGLSEEDVCARIVLGKPSYKKIISLVPKSVGLTPAVVASAIESGCVSDKDLIIMTPTLEDLGLLKVASVKERWDAATKAATDQRAEHIAKRVRSVEAKAGLQVAEDIAVQKAVEEVVKNIRIYFFVDRSGSQEGAIERSKQYIAKFLQAFPPDRLHVATFNTNGTELKIPVASAVGVEQAFRGIVASGGTNYGAGVLALRKHKPADDEDSLFIFVGDEAAPDFGRYVEDSGLRPMAFGLLRIISASGEQGACVQHTAIQLGIPCFMINEQTFADPYAIPRTIRALVAATPVGRTTYAAPAPRLTLVDTILATKLLEKPVWAA